MKTTHISGIPLLHLIAIFVLCFLSKELVNAQNPPVFKVKDTAGAVSACLTETGDLVLRGQVYLEQNPITLDPAKKYYTIKNGTNTVLAVESQSGNLYCTCTTISQNTIPTFDNAETIFQDGQGTIYAVVKNTGDVMLGGSLITATNPATNAPTISLQPVSLSTNCNQSGYFSITATGMAPLTYTWLKNGQPIYDDFRITGANLPTLSFSSFCKEDEGAYSCLVRNNLGSVQSNSASLTVNDPIITVQPLSQQTVLYGSELSLSVTALGGSELTYQWFQNGTALVNSDTIAGATEENLEIFPAKIGGSFYCQVKSGSQTLNSTTASVSIQSSTDTVTYSMDSIPEKVQSNFVLGDICRSSSFDGNDFTVTDVTVYSFNGGSRSLGSTAVRINRTGTNTFSLIWITDQGALSASSDKQVAISLSYRQSAGSQTLAQSIIRLKVVSELGDVTVLPFLIHFPYPVATCPHYLSFNIYCSETNFIYNSTYPICSLECMAYRDVPLPKGHKYTVTLCYIGPEPGEHVCGKYTDNYSFSFKDNDCSFPYIEVAGVDANNDGDDNDDAFVIDPGDVMGTNKLLPMGLESGTLIGSCDLYVPDVVITDDIPYLQTGTSRPYMVTVKPSLPHSTKWKGGGEWGAGEEGVIGFKLSDNSIVSEVDHTDVVDAYAKYPSSRPLATRLGVSLEITCDINTPSQTTFTYVRNYNIVPFELSFSVDGNRDGDLEYYKDYDRSIEFWVNNDFDAWSSTDEQDDDVSHSYINCEDPWITCPRDLEDFQRMEYHIYPGDLLDDKRLSAQVKATGTGISLFKNSDKKSVKYPRHIFESSETYTLPESRQIKVTSAYQPIPDTLKPVSFTTDTVYMLFEAYAPGSGSFDCKIEYNGIPVGNDIIGLNIKKISDMYERWTIGDKPYTISATAPYRDGFEYQPPIPTSGTEASNYILFVHGWNMNTTEKKFFAETAYKRLWWQGYKGRFGVFCWPTAGSALKADMPPSSFNPSEFIAWKSGRYLYSCLKNLRGRYSNVCIYAHSMGNIVTGEALRIYATEDPAANTSKLVDCYIAGKAAVPSQMYDKGFSEGNMHDVSDMGIKTPNCYAYYYIGGYFYDRNNNGVFDILSEEIWEDNSDGNEGRYDAGIDLVLYDPDCWSDSNGNFYYTIPDGVSGLPSGQLSYFDSSLMSKSAAKYCNFQNREDWALWCWWLNNSLVKPENGECNYSLNNYFCKDTSGAPKFQFEADRYRIFAYGVKSRTYPLGASPNVRGGNFLVGNLEELNSKLTDFVNGHDNTHPGHSKEFRSCIQQQYPFWRRVLTHFGIPYPLLPDDVKYVVVH
jgi:hypothetical protein